MASYMLVTHLTVYLICILLNLFEEVLIYFFWLAAPTTPPITREWYNSFSNSEDADNIPENRPKSSVKLCKKHTYENNGA